jgi:hypothetical protein
MSDELFPKTLVMERRKVRRQRGLTNDNNGTYAELYYVVERQGMSWLPISRGYPHSTSAYAKLGRITAHQVEAAEKE